MSQFAIPLLLRTQLPYQTISDFQRMRLCVFACFLVWCPCLFWNFTKSSDEYLYTDVYRSSFLPEFQQTHPGEAPTVDQYGAFLARKIHESGNKHHYYPYLMRIHRRSQPTLTRVKTPSGDKYRVEFHWLFGGTEEFPAPDPKESATELNRVNGT